MPNLFNLRSRRLDDINIYFLIEVEVVSRGGPYEWVDLCMQVREGREGVL